MPPGRSFSSNQNTPSPRVTGKLKNKKEPKDVCSLWRALGFYWRRLSYPGKWNYRCGHLHFVLHKTENKKQNNFDRRGKKENGRRKKKIEQRMTERGIDKSDAKTTLPILSVKTFKNWWQYQAPKNKASSKISFV